MKKKETKGLDNLIIFTGVIVVITIIIGAMFIYIPFSDKKKSLRAEILRERDKNVLIGKIRGLGKHLRIYEKRVPKEAGVSWLLREVSDIASKDEIDISSIKPGISEDYPPYTKLYVIIDVISTYNQLGKFISKIESSEKFLKVDSISIKRLDLDESFEKMQAKFKRFDIKANIIISAVVLKE